MLFQQDVPEDKGLFTFYREQAEREDEIKREKRLRKKRREMQEQQAVEQQLPKLETNSKKVELVKRYLSPKAVSPPRQPHPNSKPRSNPPKKRLLEAIVDMGKDVDPDQAAQRMNLSILRLRQPSYILKNRRYRERINQLLPLEEESARGTQGVDQMHIESLHKRNQSEELNSGRFKQAIHSLRGSVVELPEIKRLEQIKVPYRPKKSIKSKLIQEALHTRDRDKIKQIRNYLKVQSPFRESSEYQPPDEEEMQLDEKSFEVFEFRQQKLLGILKRFRRGS